jgi:uncharacterized protein (TIRG00374 family)
MTDSTEQTTPPGSPTQVASKATERNLRNGVISLAIFSLLVIAMLLAVPGLREAGERITDANSLLIFVGIALEALSCAGYVILFELVFGKMPGHLSSRLPLSELAVNSVVSASGLGGIALGAWVLRTKGLSIEKIARRSVSMFLLTSVVNVTAVAVIGIPMWLGLIEGKTDPLLTLLPAAIALATIAAVLAAAAWARRMSDDPSEKGGFRAALRALADGVEESLQMLRAHDWRLLGALGYWLFDNLVLYIALLAYGKAPSFWVVAMAYLVGMMANSLPIPGGFVAIEGGLVGMLLLFGVHPAYDVIAAVVTYRAISLWFPSVVGTLAFWSMRREIGKPLKPAPGGVASG